MREDNITSWFASRKELDRKKYPIGIGDDMAEITCSGNILLTTDMLLEGTHFDLSSASLKQVGYKAMAVNLSDSAAMASKPVAAVASVGLPQGYGEEELKELYKGLAEAGDQFGCEIIGGDITSWKKQSGLVINVAMISEPTEKGSIKRSGAKIGDMICVTGFLGGSLESGRHLSFVPRVNEALKLVDIAKINSMMDISDGLSCDLTRLCNAGGVGAIIKENSLPISEAARRKQEPVNAALNDGEDFELLFTLSKKEFETLKNSWNMDVPLTDIGEITVENSIILNKTDGSRVEIKPSGFDHLDK